MTTVTYSDILYTGKTCHEKQGEGFWKTTFVVAEDLEVIKTVLHITCINDGLNCCSF